MKFEQKFPLHACDRDSITCEFEGWKATARVYYDDDTTPPWERECGHGPVSEWTTRAIKAGERILSQDGPARRYYDFAEACKIALADGWGLNEGRKPRERLRAYAVRCAEKDFSVLQAWCKDHWFYVGVAVTVEYKGVQLTEQFDHALWGIGANYPDSDNDYLREEANYLLSAAINAAKKRGLELALTLSEIKLYGAVS